MNKPQAASAFSPDCAVVRAGELFVGKQGFTYAAAISAELVGAQALHMQILTMPPGARAKAHKHEAHETAIYVLSGEAGTWYGPAAGEALRLPRRRLRLHPGEHAASALQHERDRDLRRGHRPHRPQRAGKRRAAA